jgi:hypothetical protein
MAAPGPGAPGPPQAAAGPPGGPGPPPAGTGNRQPGPLGRPGPGPASDGGGCTVTRTEALPVTECCQCGQGPGPGRPAQGPATSRAWPDCRLPEAAAGYETQLWQVSPGKDSYSGRRLGTSSDTEPIPFQSLLGDLEGCRYDFHWYDCPHARLLQWYQESQQDALRLTWAGIIAGTDGGVDWKN